MCVCVLRHAAAPAVYASWRTVTSAICLITPAWNQLSRLLFLCQLFFVVVQRITQPGFAMALSVLWWFKVMRMPVTKMGTKMAFKHGPEGAKIVCFGKCIFLTNKRHWCAGREKCLAKSGWCTSSPCRELTNSWPAIQWMQWSCHRSASTACDA